jgi:transposase
MADQDRERWTKLVADFETSELTQREFASEARNLGLDPVQ